jgi:hypothetical protein
MQQQGNPWDIQPGLEDAQAYQKAYQQASQQVQSQNPRDVKERQSPAVSGSQSGGLLRKSKRRRKTKRSRKSKRRRSNRRKLRR